jgi:glycerol-3-phosphate dehydrogenase
MFGIDDPLPLLAAMNLVVRRTPKEVGLAAPTSAGRMLTLVPWHGHAIVGTSHSSRLVDPQAAHASRSEIDAFIAEANEAFPALALMRGDVTLVHRGLVPATVEKNGQPELRSGPSLEDHERKCAAGAMTVIGVKYTTARGVAERTVNTAARRLGRSIRRSATATTVLPSAGIGDHAGLAIETAKRSNLTLPTPVLTRLSDLYADRAADIIRLMAAEPDLQQPLAEGSAATAAEVAHVVRTESALHLGDVVLRRTALGAAGHPGAEVLSGAASVAARELGWDEARRAREIAAVEAVYRVP